jgi:hypothetical protein
MNLFICSLFSAMLSGPLVTTAWRVPRLRMEGMDCSRQGVVSSLGVGRGANNSSP